MNLYAALFSFLSGFAIGFIFEWLLNHRRRVLIPFILIIAVWLVIEIVLSVFYPDTVLRKTYSEPQGWVDFMFGLAGYLTGSYLENRRERNRKYKIILHYPRQAPAYVRAEHEKMCGFIGIVPETRKLAGNETFVMGGLPKYVLDLFFKMPKNKQEDLVNSTVKAVGELKLFQYRIANTESVPDLIDELKKLRENADILEKKGLYGIEDRFALWLGRAKLELIKVRMQEIQNIH